MFRLPLIAVLIAYAPALFGGVVPNGNFTRSGVVLDGSFGTSGALPGPNYLISANLGKQVGTNLFHSFNQFDLTSADSATFTGPSNIQNIISRVTGGSPSSIDGKINSDIQGANLFFLNPAGVMFGPHAQLDVSGSVAVTTANYVKMVGGGRFNANLGGQDVLTSAPVSSFGFLNSAPAPVSIIGSNKLDVDAGKIIPGPGLVIPPAKSFSIVAGDITVDAGYIHGEGSRVNLVSVMSPGEAQFNATDINNTAVDVTQFAALGNIALTNFARIDTSGPSGGPISINGGNLLVSSAEVIAETMGPFSGGAMSVVVRGSVNIINGGEISVITRSSGQGGDLSIDAGSVVIDGSIPPDQTSAFFLETDIIASSFSSGNAGNIVIKAGDLVMNKSFVFSFTFSSGDAGNVTVIADSFLLNGGGIFTSAAVSGSAGNISVQTNQLEISRGARINSDGLTASANGGNINIQAQDHLRLRDSQIRATAARGVAGNITIDSPFIALKHGKILAQSLRGQGGNIDLVSKRSIRLFDHSAITASAGTNGGNITITDPVFVLLNNSLVEANAAIGQGGNITIDSIAIQLKKSTITARAGETGGQIGLFTSFLVGPVLSTASNGTLSLPFHSSISATGGTTNGTINITAPELDLGSQLITLPSGLVSAANQLQERCTTLLQGDVSTFVTLGRGGTEPEPDELQGEF